MKHYFSSLQAVLFASLILASCNSKEIASPDDESSDTGIPFEVSTVITKTTNDGLQTTWAKDDAINLFHAESGATTYTSDGKFTVDEGLNGVFSGTLGKALEEGNSYDWYAFYPYTAKITTPANTSAGWVTVGGTSQTQTDNDSRAHLAGTNCPLYGVVKDVASSDMPAFAMNQLTSVVAVNVTNTLSEALTVSSVSFTSTEDIVGTYYINITGDAPVYTSRGGSYVSKTATLTVENGTAIAQGETAKFYIAIKPHTVTSGSTLTVSVNGVEKTLTLTSDVTFTAGHIKTVKYSYEGKYVSIPWNEDFSGSLDNYTLVNGDSVTKIYEQNLAGGKSPELLVGKNNGSFSVYVVSGGISKKYRLAFSSNYYDRVSVSSPTEGVTITKEENADGKYLISLADGVSKFKLAFENKTTDNYRLDDISLVPDTKLSAPQNVMASLNEDDADVTNAIDVVWDAVENAGSYVVTATPTLGKSVSVEVSNTSCTIKDLLYETEYAISVYAKPSDAATYDVSEATEYAEKIVTGENPSGVLTYTYTITTSDFSATGYGRPIKEISAKSSDESKVLTVTHKDSDAGLVGSSIQFKKSSGLLYNTTNLGSVKSVVLNDAAASASYVIYIGASENPTSVGSGGYFAIKNTSGSNVLTCKSITVTFEK